MGKKKEQKKQNFRGENNLLGRKLTESKTYPLKETHISYRLVDYAAVVRREPQNYYPTVLFSNQIVPTSRCFFNSTHRQRLKIANISYQLVDYSTVPWNLLDISTPRSFHNPSCKLPCYFVFRDNPMQKFIQKFAFVWGEIAWSIKTQGIYRTFCTFSCLNNYSQWFN